MNIKILTFFIFIIMYNLSYADNDCKLPDPYNLSVQYNIKNDILNYKIFNKKNDSFSFVNLKDYSPFPAYLGIKIIGQPIYKHKFVPPHFFTEKNAVCADNINNIHQHYQVYSSSLDSMHISQVYLFPLDNKYIKTTQELSGSIDIYKWLKSISDILPPDISGKKNVEIDFTLLHDNYLKTGTVFKINTIVDFDKIK